MACDHHEAPSRSPGAGVLRRRGLDAPGGRGRPPSCGRRAAARARGPGRRCATPRAPRRRVGPRRRPRSSPRRGRRRSWPARRPDGARVAHARDVAVPSCGVGAATRRLPPTARRAADRRDADSARDARRDRAPLARTAGPPPLRVITDLVLTAGVRADPFARPPGGVCMRCTGRTAFLAVVAMAFSVAVVARAADDAHPPDAGDPPSTQSDADAPASPESTDETHLQELVVEAQRPVSAASSREVRAKDFMIRPHLTMTQVLNNIPGLLVAQHQGGAKAPQWFLRGFDADHGTDVAVYADDMPINLVSHAHGQGYADPNFLIPEVIDRVELYKGPYFPQFGDFATAGAVKPDHQGGVQGELPEGGGRVVRHHALRPRRLTPARQREDAVRRAGVSHQRPVHSSREPLALQRRGPHDARSHAGVEAVGDGTGLLRRLGRLGTDPGSSRGDGPAEPVRRHRPERGGPNGSREPAPRLALPADPERTA